MDFRLVQNTFVTMFWRSSLLSETVGWLLSHGYEVAEFDAGSWADAFAAVDRRTAQIMLNIIADQARSAVLFGTRIICLVQSNDPQLSFAPVGAMPVMWKASPLMP